MKGEVTGVSLVDFGCSRGLQVENSVGRRESVFPTAARDKEQPSV